MEIDVLSQIGVSNKVIPKPSLNNALKQFVGNRIKKREWEEFDSSWLDSASYSYASEQLTISTLAGYEYIFFGVPEYKFQDIAFAESAGRYFNNNIKNQYDYIRVA